MVQFLSETLERCHRYQHDLLFANLDMATKLPLNFVKRLLSQLAMPFSQALSYGSGSSSQLLKLTESVVDALIRWHEVLGGETRSGH